MRFWSFLFSAAIAFAGSASAQTTVSTDTATPITRSSVDGFRITNRHKVQGRIAFTANIANSDQLFIADLEKGEVVKVLEGPGNSTYPAWSPDGMSLAFVSDREGNKEIYVIEADGTKLRRITNNKETDDQPTWSPDGNKILFTSGRDNGETFNLFTIDPGGKGSATAVTNFTGKNVTPAWLPDGDGVIYSTNRFWPGWDVCTYSIKSRKEQCLLAGRSSFSRPRYSNNGLYIVYSIGDSDATELGIYDVKKGTQSTPLPLDGKDYDATWSPDDQYIAFTNDGAAPPRFDLNLYSIEKKESGPLITSDYSVRYLSWSKISARDINARKLKNLDPSLEVVPDKVPANYTPPYLMPKRK